MVNINHLGTEQRNEKTKDLDLLSTMEIIQIMNEEDLNVVAGVKQALPQIEKVVHAMIEALSNGGRIVYVGAGTSGRTGIIDAVECGPTFSCTYEFLGLIAGGYGAIVKAVEGAEDKKELCVEDLKNNNFTEKDLLVGVAASGRTPYVIGGIEYAKSLGLPQRMTDENYWFRMTARQTAAYFKDIYYFIEQHINGSLMEECMENAEYREMFSAALPDKTVAEKYGYLPQEDFYTLGDAGIVYGTDSDYVLVVYVRGTGTSLNTEFFREAAALADELHELL